MVGEIFKRTLALCMGLGLIVSMLVSVPANWNSRIFMAIYSGDQNEIIQSNTVGPTAVAVGNLVDPASMPYCPTPDICKMRTGSVCCNFGIGGQLGDVSSQAIISPLNFTQSQMLPTGSSPNSLLKPPRLL